MTTQTDINIDILNDNIDIQIEQQQINIDIQGAVISGSTNVKLLQSANIAGSAISAYRILRSDPDGKLYVADSSNHTQANQIVGLSLQAAAANSAIPYIIEGELTGTFNFQVGLPVFFDNLGKLTQAKPVSGFTQIVANVINQDTIAFKLQSPVII